MSIASREVRRGVLGLYKKCLKSALRIPDPEQRAIYTKYVMDSFRGRRDLPADSKAALLAIRDAEEQVERMNYYHSIREARENQTATARHASNKRASLKPQTPTSLSAGGANRSGVATKENIGEMQTSHSSKNKILDGRLQPGEKHIESSDGSKTSSEQVKRRVVHEWLKLALPHLHDDDMHVYVQRLVDDGFDSIGMLETELIEEDLTFMKKAHRRALIRNKLRKK